MNLFTKVLKVIGVVVTVALLLFFIVIPLTGASPTSASGDEDKDDTTLSKEARAAIAELLTVKTTSADAECATDDYGLVSYQIGALEAVPEPRKWSDGISTPIAATEVEAARDELQVAICKDPLLGVSYLTFLATDARDALLASTGVDILEINAWLKPYAVETSEINTIAAGFIPLMDVKEPTSAQIDKAMEQNRSWQTEASYANTMFDRFAMTGIEARQSTVNYHLAAGGLAVGSLPAVERNGNEEDLPALIFSLTEKDQCEPLLEIGANVGDKRPELFKAKVCETPPTDTTDCKKPCKPPVVECPPGWDGTPPNCKAPASEDPAANGNAPIGGGKNSDSGPGTYVPPDKVDKPPKDVYVPPAPPKDPPKDPPQDDPAPPPAPETSAPPKDKPATGCTPPRGKTTC